MGTKFNILEMKTSSIQGKFIKTLKAEAFILVNLAQSKKNEMMDTTMNDIFWCLRDKELTGIVKEKTAMVICIPKGLVILVGR